MKLLKAVVPMSVIDDEMEATSLGTQVASHFVDLPIGEPSPVVRLHQVSYSFEAHKQGAAPSRPTDWPGSPGSRRRPSTPSGPGSRRRSCGVASTCR